MKRQGLVRIAIVWILVTLVLAVALNRFEGSVDVRATEMGDSVISYGSTTVLNGSTAYTTTAYTDGYLVGGHGHIQIQSAVDLSATGTVTVAPQFSNEPVGCGAVSDWVTVTDYDYYPDESTSTAQMVLADGESGAIDMMILGRCVRLAMETSGDHYTPTVYLRWIDR
jgi:hypothetical protein